MRSARATGAAATTAATARTALRTTATIAEATLALRLAGARRAAPVHMTGRLRVDDVETRLRAARDGRGIAQLLSYQVADDLAAGKLVRLLQAWERPPLPVHLVTKGRAHRAPKIEAFLTFAAKRLLALPVLRPG